MTSAELHDVAERVRHVQIERALDRGNHDTIIAEALSYGVRDGDLVEVGRRNVAARHRR